MPATWVRPEPKPWYYVKCATAHCDCRLSYNGAPNQACSRRCRDEHPCSLQAGESRPHHDIPTEVPLGRVATRMQGNKQALAEPLVAIPHITGDYVEAPEEAYKD